MSPKAKQAKGRARINAYEDLLSQEYEQRREDREIYIPPGPRLGDVVIEFGEVRKAYGDRVLLEDFSASIPPGSIVGIVGPNGAGKTTLLRMVTQQEDPVRGTVRVGDTVEIAYADQSRSLDGEATVYEEISGGAETLTLGKREVNARAYCASFNFTGSDQQKKVGVLSGGERNRVHLAKTLTESANVLLLDEPTNDLDVNTLRALEEALQDFAGSAVVVSHDRWFLDRIATHILAFEGEGRVRLVLGSWSDYEQDYAERYGEKPRVRRGRYRGLKRRAGQQTGCCTCADPRHIEEGGPMANRLAGETSPYLLQHADNPVEWYPWGEGAFRRAREEDKPVFLSIKVDREEHPDLDDIYMQAVVRMTGRGGWPMSVWLTPDGSPFMGGTYYPGAPRMGMPSFRQVLEFVVAKWEEERDRVDQTAEELTGLLRDDAGSLGSAVPTLDEGISDRAVEDLEQYYDPHNGGWGHSPKFPQAMTVDFLLSRYQRTGDARVLAMVEGALQAMAAGGIYDQLGGGFHRYSVDAEWLVPHFEKMLYDNALLSRGYLHAYLVTGEETYRRVAGEVLDYVLREMADPGGRSPRPSPDRHAGSPGRGGRYRRASSRSGEPATPHPLSSGESHLPADRICLRQP